MLGCGMEVCLQYFHLPISRLTAVNPGVEDRRQGLAQRDSGCQYTLSIMRVDRAAKFSCLLRRQQAQLHRKAEKICIGGKQVLWICGEAQVQGVDELQGGVSSKQLKRLGKGTTHYLSITLKNSFKG